MLRNLKSHLQRIGDEQKKTSKPSCEPDNGGCYIRVTKQPVTTQELDSLSNPEAARLMCGVHGFDPMKTLFFDTETTGLSGGAGTVIFLVCGGWLTDGGRTLHIEQALMRDYAEEYYMLSRVADWLERFEYIVTFNGKSFDLPLLHSRFIMNRMRERWRELSHLDLLHPARRIWKLRLKSCSLSHLENNILDFHREGDVEGSEIPAIYYAYLKSRDFSALEPVVEHNMMDVASLLKLLSVMLSAFDSPQSLGEQQDIFSIGRALEKVGEKEAAAGCYRVAAAGSLRGVAKISLSQLLKKQKEFTTANQLHLEMIEARDGGIYPYIELAKFMEHSARDIPSALFYTQEAIRRANGAGDKVIMPELVKRQKRLLGKMARGDGGWR